VICASHVGSDRRIEYQVYIDFRSKFNGKNDASRHIVMVTRDLHGNEAVVGLYWGLHLQMENGSAGIFLTSHAGMAK
jgi:hypothetical protein